MHTTIKGLGNSEELERPDVRFLLLPLPDFTLLPFGGFLDKLRFSADDEDHSRQRFCEWTLLGLSADPVRSSSGVTVGVDVTADSVDIQGFEYLVVFGSRTAEGSKSMANAYGPLLRRAASSGLSLVSVDNASFLLAQAGLLNGYKIALHWRHVPEFRTAFPRIDIRSELIYCFDRDRISCAGGSTAIDMAVELLSRHCGRERALKGLADMLVDEPRSQGHQLKSLEVEPDAGRHLSRAIALMRTLLADPMTVPELASRLGLGRRHLDRLFMARFQVTAHDYWTKMRMDHVHWRVLNSDHSLAGIADEVGVGHSSHLCRVFRKQFGYSPGTLRTDRRASRGLDTAPDSSPQGG
ncbi:MAG: helix-turn-helix domain-containing protein [Rhodoferax sp.]|nr:helix-turn-helix domain-containing protein [Rhodoferax sp.]